MKQTKKLALVATAIVVSLACLFLTTNLNLKFFEGDEVIIDYVISVHDGDTIRTQNLSETVRILHIDAPEVIPQMKDYYGIEARDFLKDKILNKTVKLKCKGTDKYKRHLCEIYPEDANTNDIKNSYNYLMVKEGYACPFRTGNNEIKDAGRKARNKRIGIFSENSTYRCREEF